MGSFTETNESDSFSDDNDDSSVSTLAHNITTTNMCVVCLNSRDTTWVFIPCKHANCRLEGRKGKDTISVGICHSNTHGVMTIFLCFLRNEKTLNTNFRFMCKNLRGVQELDILLSTPIYTFE